jgi:uncharacterized protein YutE (UPF0331/DUF86 family)
MNLQTQIFTVNEEELSSKIGDIEKAMGMADEYLNSRSGEELMLQHLNKEATFLIQVRDNLEYEGRTTISRDEIENNPEIYDEVIDFLEEEGFIDPEYNPLQSMYLDILDHGGILDWLSNWRDDDIDREIKLVRDWLESDSSKEFLSNNNGLLNAKEFLLELTNMHNNLPIKRMMNYYNQEIGSQHKSKKDGGPRGR